MSKCFFYSSDGEQCENESLDKGLYCTQHNDFEKDTGQKVTHLVTAFTYAQKNRSEKKKDLWDKVSSSSTLISGLIVGLLGIFATTTYNNRELKSQKAEQLVTIKVQRVEIVQKFFLHLISAKESEKKGALLAIASIGDEKLATDLAKHFGGSASRDVLSQLASSASPVVAKEAQEALDANIIADKMKSIALRIIVRSTDDNGVQKLVQGSAFLVSNSGCAVTA